MNETLEQKIKAIAKEDGVILLYHSVDTKVPVALSKTVHNISPACMDRHIKDISQFFKFVSLQDFCKSSSKAGLAVVTFDDGYKNVIRNALPVLDQYQVPCTLFLNPVTFSGAWNWRDKIRYLIHHKLEKKFLQQNRLLNQDGLFYRFSKNPANNSAKIDAALDVFLAGQTLDIYDEYPYLQAADLVVDNQRVNYGNHTQNHYVLSSLSDQNQFDEIEIGENNLRGIKSASLSNCFSAPFGGDSDINSFTLSALTNLGYKAMLMSRRRRQPGKVSNNRLQMLERFMPRSDDILAELTSL